MPFDTTEARRLVASLQAHQRHPGGELMLKAAQCLNEALEDAAGAMGRIRSAEAEAEKQKTAYDSALLEIKTARERALVTEEALGVVKQIAETKKGASKVAIDWLTAKGLTQSLPPAVVQQ